MTLTVEANGASIPAIGFGTWQLTGRACQKAVETALQAGYRHLDTAAMYDNEREVGAGLRASGLARDEVFVTTKVWRDDVADGDLQRSAEASVRRLGIDAPDLLLIHWPNEDVPMAESIAALCDARTRGLTRHIGVSNYTVAMIEEAVALASAPLVTNQVEYHAFLDQSKVLAACRRHGMALTAYCPLGRGRVFESDLLSKIAGDKGRTVGQVATRWLIQQPGVVAIPRSSRPDRIAENFDIFDFELSEAEMDRIAKLASSDGRVVDLAWAPAWD